MLRNIDCSFADPVSQSTQTLPLLFLSNHDALSDSSSSLPGGGGGVSGSKMKNLGLSLEDLDDGEDDHYQLIHMEHM